MWHWTIVTLIVCSFGFFKDLRPSEAYLTAYLTGPWKNLTEEQVDNEIYPWWTYSYLLWLVPVFLLTDYFRYKPIFVVLGVAYIVTWALLLWAQGVPAMRLMQVTFGLGTAGEISYYSYLYAIVPNDYFLKVTSFTRAASLIGKFTAYLCGQLLTSFNVLNYYQLNIFSFVSVIVAFVISIILPQAEHSELFNPKVEPGAATNPNLTEMTEKSDTTTSVAENRTAKCKCTPASIKSLAIFLMNEIKSIYLDKTILLWSIWWAFASCGNFQVGNYVQNLWHILTPYKNNRTKRHLYNGAVEAAGLLFSLISVFMVGFLPVNWSVRWRSEILITVVCAINAVFLIVMATTSSIWVCYVMYDLFRATYQIVVTVASAEIARKLSKQRYGFVFGCNTFVALIIETILTAIVVDKAGLDVDIQTQFVVYGAYFAVMAVMATVLVIVKAAYLRHQSDNIQQYIQMDELGNG